MKCRRCEREYPSKYYFATPALCTQCYSELPEDQRDPVSAELEALPQNTGVFTGAEHSSPPGAARELVGIGGWLILPAIGLVLSAVIAVVGLIVALALFSDVSDAGYSGLYTVEILVELGLLVYLLYAASRFFGKKSNAPATVIGLMIAGIVASGFLLLVELSVGADAFAVESGKQLVRGTIAAAIWIPYFKVSRRVKATFVN